MLEHPGIELQLLIKEKGLTQKAFSSILGKKVSEVNELLKGKRNITIQRDYLLHQTLGTPIKYRILKQVDYDYSLINIEETPRNDVILSDNEESIGANISSGASANDLKGEINEPITQDSLSQTPQNDKITQTSHSEHNEESINDNTSFGTEFTPLSGVKIQENIKQIDSSADKSASEGQSKSQKIPIKEPESKNNEDLRNRAKIFRSF